MPLQVRKNKGFIQYAEIPSSAGRVGDGIFKGRLNYKQHRRVRIAYETVKVFGLRD